MSVTREVSTSEGDRDFNKSDAAETLLPPGEDTVAFLLKNSTDLLELATTLKEAADGGNIVIADSQFSRPGGTIKIDAGDLAARTLTLRNLVVSADTINATAFNADGRDGLVIDGGSYRATSMLSLLSRGNSTLRFRGNVDLDTPFAELRAAIIEVERGGNVTISGAGAAFTREARFNRLNYGNIEAKGGLTVFGE